MWKDLLLVTGSVVLANIAVTELTKRNMMPALPWGIAPALVTGGAFVLIKKVV